jgi:putative tryptophan/tyrosine transport system substrate-binding protein
VSAQLKRRQFIKLLGSAAATWPLAARAQQGERMRRIGLLLGFPEADVEGEASVAAFQQRLQELGWSIAGYELVGGRQWDQPPLTAAS